MRIPERRSVRDHDRRITALPERPLVRPANSRNGSGKRGPFAWNPACFSKRSNGRAQKRTRAGVRGKPDEVASARIEEAEPGRRIFLRSRRVRKIADRLQAYHSRDSIAALLAALRINETSHLFRLKVGRLFIHERDEAQRLPGRFPRESPRQGE